MEIRQLIKKSNPKSTWLLNHRHNVTSQCGEDGIITKIFEIIPTSNEKVCVEFGAWDGKHYSNTFNLMNSSKWSGYFIEADADRFLELKNTYKSNHKACLINRLVSLEKGQGTLKEILLEYKCPRNIDLLSIDIDGNDYHIWNELDYFLPRVVLVEFNPSVPNDISFIQDRSFEVNQGSSLLAFERLGFDKGYRLVSVTDWNAIFVKDEYFSLFDINDNSLDAMYVPLMDGRIFHGFDGTIYTCGMPSLIWHQVQINNQDLQVLPKNMRVFGDRVKI
jgi:hypothetical protein